MIQLTTAAHCLAMLRSRQAVKAELQRQGLKLSHYAAREITSWAMVYLDDRHETLIPDAIEEARAMILSGTLGKRAQRASVQIFQVMHNARRPDPSRLWLCKSHAQNGA